MSEIKAEELSELAPHILASCKLSLDWLEGHELGESEAALRLRDAITLLEHSGVAFDLALLEGPDEQELAELHEAIAESDFEDANGIVITQQDIETMIAEMFEQKPARTKKRSA